MHIIKQLLTSSMYAGASKSNINEKPKNYAKIYFSKNISGKVRNHLKKPGTNVIDTSKHSLKSLLLIITNKTKIDKFRKSCI